MNYQEWLNTIPKEFTEDALWKMEVYRLALFAGDIAWLDVTRLMQDRRTLSLADPLYRAGGSISGNYSESYNRSSHKEQVRFSEYSLGAAREWRMKTRFLIRLWQRRPPLKICSQPSDFLAMSLHAIRNTQHASHA